MNGLAIMKANDVFQTKYVALLYGIIYIDSSIGAPLHIVINDVTKNVGTSYENAQMNKETTIYINDGYDPSSYGTWTSTIKPNNVTVELDCVVVEVNNDMVTARCDSETMWPESVFNRIPIRIYSGNAQFGYSSITNRVLFGTDGFKCDGSIPDEWSQYNVGSSGSSLTIGNRFTIKELPESFVSHWVDMGAKAYMGNKYIMLVPPGS